MRQHTGTTAPAPAAPASPLGDQEAPDLDDDRWHGRVRSRSQVRHALVRFSVSSLVALVVIAGGTVLAAERVSRGEVLRHAERTGRAVADDLVAPLLDEGLRRGDPATRTRLDRVMGNRMADGSLVRVKIWSPDGVILWSDDERLVGERFALEPQERGTLQAQGSSAGFSRLDRPENVYEQDAAELVEVYVGFRDTTGQPLLFEVYLPTAGLQAESAAQLRTLLPVTVGGPLLLMLVLFPLALTMARRVDRAGEERAGLLRHAVEASALERRRIAGDLHDGVVQDLAGIGYALPAIVATLDDHPRLRGTRADLERVAGIVHQDLAALRSVITEIYPADLREGGLTPAAQQLAADARRAGVEVEVDVASELAGRGLPPDAAMLAYRVVREALRNVVRHARATSVQVTVRRGGRDSRDVVVRVVDDGVGFDGPVPRPTGHFGLRLLSDTIQDLSGTFEIRSAAGRGTEVEARFPIDWASR